MFDVHTHLTDEGIFQDLEGNLRRAREAGVRRFLIPAYSPLFWERARDIAEKNRDVYFAIGVHPLFLDDKEPLGLREALVKHPKCLAVGEVGLDAFLPGSDLARQSAWFEREAAFAAEYDKPLVIHCRKAYFELLELLKRQFQAKPVSFLLHSCSCSKEQLGPFLEMGAYVSFSGTITRSNARKTKELALSVPNERVLLETDSPYIGTDQVRPPLVRPLQFMEVAEAYAELTGLSLEETEKLTDANAERFFRLEQTSSSFFETASRS